MASLILAVRFLTIVPVPGREAAGPGALGRAAWWFPVVGLGLGAALAAADRLLAQAFPPMLAAVLVLVAWKVATGGIHLDGLADSLDGLGGATREQRLAIMRDSRIGVFGAAGLMLCILTAVIALAELPAELRGMALMASPALGRIAPALAGSVAAAAPRGGLGADFLDGLSRWCGPVQLVAAGAALALALGVVGIVPVAAAAGATLLWAALMIRRLGGLTGDALGAALEVAELAALLAFATLGHRRWV